METSKLRGFWVYVHTCPNGKKYVGCTTRLPRIRWSKGTGYTSGPFKEAILNFGWDSITHEVFEVKGKEEMFSKEKELIKLYKTTDPEYGYNCSVGGPGCGRGQKRSEETRKKASRKRWQDPEYRGRILKKRSH